MAIVKVKKVCAAVLRRDTEAAMNALQNEGVLHITQMAGDERYSAEENGAAIAALEAQLQDVRLALGVITQYDNAKRSFLTPKPEISYAKLKAGDEQGRAAHAVAQAKAIERELGEIRSKYAKAANALQQLAPFRELAAPVELLGDTPQASIFCGFVPKDAAAQAVQLAEASGGLFHLQLLEQRSGDFLPALFVMHSSVAEETRLKLKEQGCTELRFDGFTGTVADRIAALEEEQRSLAQARRLQEQRATEAAAAKGDLELYEDYLQNELARQRAIGQMGATDRVNFFQGYVKHYDAERLEKALAAATDAYWLELADPEEDDPEVPTPIENNRVLRPFEAVTEMYSTPAYRGIDPVWVLAPFYFIFFGMMLSDAAYGILLTLGAIAVLKLKKPDGMFRKVTGVLAICGIATVFWGAMFGSWMGFSAEAPLFNPMYAPLEMLILCIGIGLAHLLVALGTGFYMLARDGHIWDAIFDKGFWMLILLAIPVLAVDLMNGGSGTAGLLLGGAGLVGLICTQGRHKKGFVKKLIGGLASVYDITGYLSDLLSYSRIFGMSLATAVIGMVFNTIVGMLTGGGNLLLSILGWIVGIAIFAIGHGFNLGINALGAYVHSARLQYIESFNKFFVGEGKPFRPLRYSSKNSRVVPGKQ